MNNDTHQSLNCPVCLTPFDPDKYIPKIFPNCGHTVCKECLVHVLEMDTPKCPLDKQIFGQDFQPIEDFPTNFLGKDLLEMVGKWSRCKSHKEPNKMICITDNTAICANCALFGEHKGHEIKLLSDFEELANLKRTQLSNLADTISISVSQLAISFEEMKQNMKETIKERFRDLHATIAKQEFQVLFQLENMFLEEKIKCGNLTSFDNRTFEIRTKLSEFDSIMSNPNITTLLQEDYNTFEKAILEELTTTCSQKMEQFTDFFAAFRDSLPKEDFLRDFNVVDLLDKKLLEFNERRKQNSEEESPKQLQEISLPSVGLNIFQKNHVLAIQSSRRGSNSYSFKTLRLEKVQEIEYRMTLDEPEDEEDETLNALLWILKSIPKLTSIKFFVEDSVSPINTEKRLHSLLAATLSRPENLEKIEIEISNSVIGSSDLAFLFLAEKALPRVKNLKSFSMTSGQTQISSQVLKALAQVNWKAWSSLEKFRVNIFGVVLKESDIIQFLNVIPNAQDILLGFANTQLTDQALEIFSTKILPFLDKLERFEVLFSDTKLSSIGVEKFLMSLPPNVKLLLLGMERIAITEDGIKKFLDRKILSMTQLREFNLGISSDNISQNVMQQIREWKTKISQRNDEICSVLLQNRAVRRPTHVRNVSFA